MSGLLPVASVHGRFQPLHTEHLEYLEVALEHAQLLHVGITQFERTDLRHVPGAADERGSAASNPLTYFERSELVGLALEGLGVGRDRFRVSPFPIERDDLADFLPLDIPILTTRVDEWNDRKVELLEKHGYTVKVLYDRDPKGVSGARIRELMREGDDSWTDLVPASTVDYLRSLDVGARLRTAE